MKLKEAMKRAKKTGKKQKVTEIEPTESTTVNVKVPLDLSIVNWLKAKSKSQGSDVNTLIAQILEINKKVSSPENIKEQLKKIKTGTVNFGPEEFKDENIKVRISMMIPMILYKDLKRLSLADGYGGKFQNLIIDILTKYENQSKERDTKLETSLKDLEKRSGLKFTTYSPAANLLSKPRVVIDGLTEAFEERDARAFQEILEGYVLAVKHYRDSVKKFFKEIEIETITEKSLNPSDRVSAGAEAIAKANARNLKVKNRRNITSSKKSNKKIKSK